MKRILVLVAMIATMTSGVEAQVPSPGSRLINLNSRNTASINEHIDAYNADKDASQILLKRLTLPPEETLYIVVASLGGDLGYLPLLTNVIATLPNTELICKYCASAAAALFISTGQKRLVLDQSIMVIHHMYVNHVTADDIKDSKFITELEKSSEAFDKIFYPRLKMSKSDYENKVRGSKEWVLSSNDMLSYKIADEKVRVYCDRWISMLMPNTCIP